jgi:hypothetical protein
MRTILSVAAILAASAMLAGCFEIKQDTSLNPDGSGKAVVELTMPDMGAMGMGMGMNEKTPPPDPEVTLKQFAKKTLDDTKGVEAWSDVSFARTEDGRMKFKGTAYFKDLAAFRLSTGKGDNGPTFRKDDKGGMVLEMAMSEDEAKAPEPPAKSPPPSAEELAKLIQAARLQYQQMRPMMEMMLGKMKVEMTFRLPGTLAEVSGFEKQPDGSVRIAIDGAKMLQVMDQLNADDAYVRQAILAGKKPGAADMDPAKTEKMFGTKGPFRARATGDMKPLFDYAAAVKAAKEAYPKMIEKLGLDKVPPSTGGMTITPKMDMP